MLCEYAIEDIDAGKFTGKEFINSFQRAPKYAKFFPQYCEVVDYICQLREIERNRPKEYIPPKYQIAEHIPGLTDEEIRKMESIGAWTPKNPAILQKLKGAK